MNYRRLFSIVYLALFAAVIAFAGVTFLQLRKEHNQLLQTEEIARMQLAQRQETLRENQRILERLRTDPAFVEMVIRRRLGYAKPDEVIFRFERAEDIMRSLPAIGPEITP